MWNQYERKEKILYCAKECLSKKSVLRLRTGKTPRFIGELSTYL
jgi:hypothetical protein